MLIDIKEFPNDSSEKKLYLDSVCPNIKALEERIIISNLKESGIDTYYNNLKEYTTYNLKLQNLQIDDLLPFCAEFFGNDSESLYLYIKSYDKTIGEIILKNNGRFGIYIKEKYRNKGYGKKAMEELYNYAFLYNMDIKGCDVLELDLDKNDTKLMSFFEKCGFECDTIFHDGDKRYFYPKKEFYNFELYDIKKSDKEEFQKYLNTFKEYGEKSNFDGKFNQMIAKSRKSKYQYVVFKCNQQIRGVGYYKKTDKIPGNYAYVEVDRKHIKSGYGKMFMHMLFEKMPYDSIYLTCSYKNWKEIQFLNKLGADDVYASHGKLIFIFNFVVY